MKKVSLYTLFALIVLLLTSCSELVTPAAYTRFDVTGTQYVNYTSNANYNQIEVYKDEASFNNHDFPLIAFSFGRGLGYDSTEGYTAIDLTASNAYLTITIDKTSDGYSAMKKLYLNGSVMAPDRTTEDAYTIVMGFNTLNGFVRTNPNGHLDLSKVNVLEYL